MTKAAMVLVILALAANGCGKDGKETATTSAGGETTAPGASADKEKSPVNKGKDGTENVALAEAYAKAVCECKNAQCINEAGDKYQADTDKLYKDGQVRTPTPEQKKKMDEASAKVSECTTQVLKKR